MSWIIGIDEAGYGPNLGPLVMTAIGCRVPADWTDADLWQHLRRTVRRHGEPDDGRLVIGDSKLVYNGGLAVLETAVLAALGQLGDPLSLADYLDWLCPQVHAEVRREAWYTGRTMLPAEADRSVCAALAERFGTDDRLTWMTPRTVVLCPQRFNDLVDRWGSKGAVLAHCLGELLGSILATADGAPLVFFIDKHGGRNFYGPLLQERLTAGTVFAVQEGSERSVYRVLGLDQEVRLTFEPRADGAHLCVALASMVSKYLREMLMREFNQFWCGHVADLKPTAGYPNDARRFFTAIRPALERLGIAERALWRCK
jgi:hypothetical protein